MKIFFYNSGNPKLGSNRIYIDNLSSWLAKINVKTIVSNDLTNSKGCDIIILNKFTKYNKFKELKRLNPKNKIGLIHPSDLNHEFVRNFEIIVDNPVTNIDIDEQFPNLKERTDKVAIIQLESNDYNFPGLFIHCNIDKSIIAVDHLTGG